MHADQLTVLPETVRGLVWEQFPEWRGLGVRGVATQGTVNAIFRIRDSLAARFPLRGGVGSGDGGVGGDVTAVRRGLEDEAAAARELAGRTRFATPVPVAIGEPGHGYPLPWSVQTWVPGDVATPDAAVSASSDAFALDLASFIGSVRAIDTRGRTFRGSGRGGDLTAHDAWMETCFERSEGLLDVPRLRRMWGELRELPGTGVEMMTHGDLIPGNVLVSRGRLVGVVDVGGFGAADPALDLVAAWHLLEAGPRARLRDALGCGELEWQRGKAWALEQAMGLVWYYRETNPTMSHLGRVTLRRLVESELAT